MSVPVSCNYGNIDFRTCLQGFIQYTLKWLQLCNAVILHEHKQSFMLMYIVHTFTKSVTMETIAFVSLLQICNCNHVNIIFQSQQLGKIPTMMYGMA